MTGKTRHITEKSSKRERKDLTGRERKVINSFISREQKWTQLPDVQQNRIELLENLLSGEKSRT